MAHVLTMQEQRDNLLDYNGLIKDCAELARLAEWWGADGQSRNLARLAKHLSRRDMRGAADVRDQIISELRDARYWRITQVIFVSIFVAYVAFCVAMFVTGWSRT